MPLTVDQIVSVVAGVISTNPAEYGGKNAAQCSIAMHEQVVDPAYVAPPIPQVGLALTPTQLVDAISQEAAATLVDHPEFYNTLLDTEAPGPRLPLLELLTKSGKFSANDKAALLPLLATQNKPGYVAPPPTYLPSQANLLFAEGGAFHNETIPSVKPPDTGGTSSGQVPLWVIVDALISLGRTP